jgi:hypothetical protein
MNWKERSANGTQGFDLKQRDPRLYGALPLRKQRFDGGLLTLGNRKGSGWREHAAGVSKTQP